MPRTVRDQFRRLPKSRRGTSRPCTGLLQRSRGGGSRRRMATDAAHLSTRVQPDPGQSHSLVVGSLFALEGVERSLSGLPPACRGLIGVCNRALNGISGARPRGWEGIGRRSVTFGSGFCREAAFRDGVKSYVEVLRARASRHRRGATRSGRLRRGRGRSRR